MDCTSATCTFAPRHSRMVSYAQPIYICVMCVSVWPSRIASRRVVVTVYFSGALSRIGGSASRQGAPRAIPSHVPRPHLCSKERCQHLERVVYKKGQKVPSGSFLSSFAGFAQCNGAARPGTARAWSKRRRGHAGEGVDGHDQPPQRDPPTGQPTRPETRGDGTQDCTDDAGCCRTPASLPPLGNALCASVRRHRETLEYSFSRFNQTHGRAIHFFALHEKTSACEFLFPARQAGNRNSRLLNGKENAPHHETHGNNMG